MGVKHNFTASSGDLISSPRWNANHLISEGVTMNAITFIASPAYSYDVTCTAADTWYPSLATGRAALYIPGGSYLPGIDTTYLSIYWKSDTTATISCRIRNSGDTNTLGSVNQAATGGNEYTSGAQTGPGITWPSTSAKYVLQLSSTQAGAVVSVWHAILYNWDFN